jgi:3-carboxy-cis,cis-muconate cycloisomerase
MLLCESIASTPDMREIFAPRATVQSLLDVEAALAKAGAATGWLNGREAAAIAAACSAATIDIDQLAADGALAGTIVIPLVKWLKSAVPDHAAKIHLGGTSQDIIDTALILQLRAAIFRLQADLTIMANAAAGLAETHGTTPDFQNAFGAALKLPVPPLPWHTSRAPLIRLATAIAAAVGVAGKIGTDIALMMQSEIAEVSEPAAPGRGGSSAMAHKRNPTLSIAARAAATRMPGFVATLLSAQDQEHERAAGAWQAEAATWPPLMLAASAALAAMAEALSGLEIFPERMAANLAILPHSDIPSAVPAVIARALADHKTMETFS